MTAAGPPGPVGARDGGRVADWAASRPGPPPLPPAAAETGRRVFTGRLESGVYRVRVTDVDAPAGDEPGSEGHDLAARRELFTTPPPPFRWGDGGAGTAHLAAAVLADLLGDDLPTVRAALPYFRRFLAKLPADGFDISESVFRALLYAVGGTPGGPTQAGSQTQAGSHAGTQ